MRSLPELTKEELLVELFAANDLLLVCARDRRSTREEKLAARAYLKKVVEEVERRKDLQEEKAMAECNTISGPLI